MKDAVTPNSCAFDAFKNAAELKQHIYGYLTTLNQSPLNRLLVAQYFKQTESLKELQRLERLRHLGLQLALKCDVHWKTNPVFVLRQVLQLSKEQLYWEGQVSSAFGFQKVVCKADTFEQTFVGGYLEGVCRGAQLKVREEKLSVGCVFFLAAQ